MTSNSIQSLNTSVALTAYDLWKSYGSKTVVKGINFTLQPGEVVGLLGPNGAGKTTTVGMLYGAVIPSRGFVQVGSYQVQNQGRQARQMMGIVTQEDNLDPDLNVQENLTYFARHYRLLGRDARKRTGELLNQVGLQEYNRNSIEELSGGLKRRLVLARALIHHPQIVFLDEPTTGLDPDARQDFWRLVNQLKQEGCGVLLTTHYMDEAQRLCDRLILLQQGQVIDRGTPIELIERTVGQEVVEIEGISETIVQQLTQKYDNWYRPFGHHYLVNIPTNHPSKFWDELKTMKALNLNRRRANLEDVFLRLTGDFLSNQ